MSQDRGPVQKEHPIHKLPLSLSASLPLSLSLSLLSLSVSLSMSLSLGLALSFQRVLCLSDWISGLVVPCGVWLYKRRLNFGHRVLGPALKKHLIQALSLTPFSYLYLSLSFFCLIHGYGLVVPSGVEVSKRRRNFGHRLEGQPRRSISFKLSLYLSTSSV